MGGGTIRRWLQNFAYYDFRIEHRAGTELVDADFISRQTNLPEATASEAEDTEEWEPTFKLPKPLDKFQDLVALVTVGGSCGQVQCQPGFRCDPCIDAIDASGMVESAPPGSEPDPDPCLDQGTVAEPLTWATIRRAQREDPTLSPVIQSMEADSQLLLGDLNEMGTEEKVIARLAASLSLSTETANGEMPAGVLFYQHRAVLPRAIRDRVITGCHGTGHVGVGKTFERASTFYWWPAMYSTIREFVEHCAPCALQRPANIKRHNHHPLETVHRPRDVVYVDLLGPVTGIRSEYNYVLTCVDGFSRYCATWPIRNKKATTVARAIHDVMCRELGFATRLTADRGSEFVAMDTRAALSAMGVEMRYIPAGEHQLNACERTHKTLWGALRAIRVVGDLETWRSAVAEATYSYNITRHATTRFTPHLLHMGQEVPSPRLMYPEYMPANPPVSAPGDKIKFTLQLKEIQDLLGGVVKRNSEEAHRRTAQYYMQRTLNLEEHTWVYVHAPQAGPPYGDTLANRKLSLDWAGPYLFLRMTEDSAMAVIGQIDAGGRVVKEFEVHGTKVRPVHLTRQQRGSRTPPAVQPGRLPDFGDSLISTPSSTHPPRPEPVQTDAPTPPTLRDEALRSEIGGSVSSRHHAPVWAEPQDELADQVYDWLERTQAQDEVEPQDSVSVRGQGEEPMDRRNHGATAVRGEQLMRKQAQRRTNRDGRTRIPHSIERRPPSPDSRMQLRRRLREEDQCLRRAELHQS